MTVIGVKLSRIFTTLRMWRTRYAASSNALECVCLCALFVRDARGVLTNISSCQPKVLGARPFKISNYFVPAVRGHLSIAISSVCTLCSRIHSKKGPLIFSSMWANCLTLYSSGSSNTHIPPTYVRSSGTRVCCII